MPRAAVDGLSNTEAFSFQRVPETRSVQTKLTAYNFGHMEKKHEGSMVVETLNMFYINHTILEISL